MYSTLAPTTATTRQQMDLLRGRFLLLSSGQKRLENLDKRQDPENDRNPEDHESGSRVGGRSQFEVQRFSDHRPGKDRQKKTGPQVGALFRKPVDHGHRSPCRNTLRG